MFHRSYWLGFHVFFLRIIVRISPKLSLLVLVMFLKVNSASPRKRVWKYFNLCSSVYWCWIFKLVWNRSSDSSNFFDFPSKEGIVVVRDLGNFEILFMLLLKLAKSLFVANRWRAASIWSASNVAGVFSLRNCGWLVGPAFFVFLANFQWSSREYLLEFLSPCEDDS